MQWYVEGRWKSVLVLFLSVVFLSGLFFVSNPFRSSLLADISLALVPTKSNTPLPSISSSANRAQSDTGLGLGFSTRGVVKKVFVSVGDRVAAGELLAELDSSLTLAQLHEAQAMVDIQQATRARLQAGSSAVDIAIAMSKVNIAQANVDDAKKSLFAALLDAYTKADDGVRAKADQFFVSARANPQLTLVTESPIQSDINSKRSLMENILTTWKNALTNVNPGDDLTQYLAPAESNLMQVRNFLSIISGVLNGSYQDSVNSAATVRNWRFDLYTARTNLDTALKNLWAAEGKLQSAQSTFALAQAELDQKKQPATPAVLALEEGKINEAKAKVETLQASMKQMSIIAPRAGTISLLKMQDGAIVNSFSSVIFIK